MVGFGLSVVYVIVLCSTIHARMRLLVRRPRPTLHSTFRAPGFVAVPLPSVSGYSVRLQMPKSPFLGDLGCTLLSAVFGHLPPVKHSGEGELFLQAIVHVSISESKDTI